MKIGFRLDAGSEVGLGHFYRCLSIAETFLGLGSEVHFLSINLSDRLQEVLRKRGAGVSQISSSGPNVRLRSKGATLNRLSLNDASQTSVVSNTLGLDLLVVDHYGIDQAWVTSLEKKGPRLLQLMDFPSFKGGDFLLDYGFDASLVKHKVSEIPAQGLLLGPKFAPVSIAPPDYDEALSLEASRSVPRVSIALGSAVSASFLKSIELEYVSSDRNFSLAIVSENKSSNGSGANGVDWLAPSNGLGGLFSGSDFAVTSGGVSMYERIAYGVPGIVVETATNQRGALQAIAPDGLGDDTFMEAQDLSPKSLLDTIGRRLSLGSDSAQSLLLKSTIDFFGPLRIAFSLGICERSSNLVARRFEPKDSPILLNWANDPDVRSNSISSHKISPQAHLLWQESLPSNGTQIWIFDYQGIPFGQVRFELENCRTFVSYSVDSLFRGLRLSREMLSIAIRKASIHEDIFAKAKPTNMASIKILTALGFFVASSRDDLITFVLPQGLNS